MTKSFKKNEMHRQNVSSNIWNGILEENDNYNEVMQTDLVK
jgi:hypothetical protein